MKKVKKKRGGVEMKAEEIEEGEQKRIVRRMGDRKRKQLPGGGEDGRE